MSDFKYGIYHIVYDQRNQKKGTILQRNKIAGNNFYLVKMSDNGNKIWIEEKHLDSELMVELFTSTTHPPLYGKETNVEQFKKEYMSFWGGDPGIISLDSLTQNNRMIDVIQAMEYIANIKYKIKEMKRDLERVDSYISKRVIEKEIETLQNEYNEVHNQLKQTRISVRA